MAKNRKSDKRSTALANIGPVDLNDKIRRALHQGQDFGTLERQKTARQIVAGIPAAIRRQKLHPGDSLQLCSVQASDMHPKAYDGMCYDTTVPVMVDHFNAGSVPYLITYEMQKIGRRVELVCTRDVSEGPDVLKMDLKLPL